MSVTCGLLSLLTLIVSAANDPRPGDFGHRWVRSRPFVIMGLCLTDEPHDVVEYKEAGMSYMLAWKMRSGILEPTKEARLPWLGHFYTLPKKPKPMDQAKEEIARLIRDYPQNIGWIFNDEPGNDAEMTPTGQMIDWLRTAYPDKIAMSNFVGGAGTLTKYMALVHPDILMFDTYPFGCGSGRVSDGYYEYMSRIRATALKAKIPYWCFIQSYEDAGSRRRLPSESDLRMQVFSSLAYGFTGLAYFTYDPTFDGSVFDADGSRRPLYDDVVKVNREVARLGRCLRLLTSTGVYGISGTGKPFTRDIDLWQAGAPDDSKIASVKVLLGGPDKNGLIGFFRDEAGQEYFMLANLWHGENVPAEKRQTRFQVTFDPAVKTVLRLSRRTGRVERLSIDKPENGLTITLPGGTGDLFKYDTGCFAGLDKP